MFNMQSKFVLTLVLAALTAPTALALDPGSTEVSVKGAERYIVGFYGTPPSGDSYLGERVVAADLDLNFLVVETSNAAALRAKAMLDADVRYVEYDDPFWATSSFVPNDYFWGHSANYGPKIVGAPVAWDLTLGSTAVKVAVIDSGVLATHEDLQGARFLAGYDYAEGDATPNDDCGHGTHVLATVASNTNNGKGFAGYAQVTVASLKGLDFVQGGCYGAQTWLVNALKAAADGGYHFSSNSWGGAGGTAFNDAIAYAFNKGVVMTAAAGNSGPCTSCVGEPWASNGDKVIIVSATNALDAFATTYTGSTSGSSQGPTVDVSAPGDEIGQAYIQPKGSKCGNACYVKLSGTSMATPAVTGILALVKTLNPTFGYAELDARIKGTSVDLGLVGFDHQHGVGRVNAAAAVY